MADKASFRRSAGLSLRRPSKWNWRDVIGLTVILLILYHWIRGAPAAAAKIASGYFHGAANRVPLELANSVFTFTVS